MDLNYFHAVVLGVVEGLTEFLPVSSTGHLTIAEKMLGLKVDDPAVTAYTAIIQVPAILATFIYFARKIARLFMAWVRGLTNPKERGEHDYVLAWAVIIGSIPVGLVGLLLKNMIEGPLRSLWVVAGALVLWSAVMWFAEERHSQLEAEGKVRGERDVNVMDGIVLGIGQCFSLIPGVSRSGTTISFGLMRGLNRVVATELSFFMAIPALTAAGLFQTYEARHELGNLGYGPMLVGMVVSGVVAYLSIAWLLRFLENNSLKAFVGYRVVVGLLIMLALGAGWMSAV